MPRQLVTELHALEWMCLILSVIFCKLKNEGSWEATRLRQILFQIGKHIYREFQMLQQAYGEDCFSSTEYHEWYCNVYYNFGFSL